MSLPHSPEAAPTPPAAASPTQQLDADAIAAAVARCLAVTRLTAGPFGSAAVYLPGRRIIGLEITGEVVGIHVVGRYGWTIAEIAQQVRDAVWAVAPGAVTDVTIEDLDVADGPVDRPVP